MEEKKGLPEIKIGGKSISIVIIAAVAAALIVGIFVITKVVVPAQKYNSAVALMEAGEYEQAIAAFELMDGYKDSDALIDDCKIGILENKYNAAMALMKDAKYEEAIDAFTAIDYKDSKTKIDECRVSIKELKYEEALDLMAAGNYLDAGRILKTLDYKDSAEKFAECRATAPYDFTEVGDIITFGRYEQDGNHDNGPEELEWRVLDKEDGKVFIMSDKAVEMLPYFGIYWKRSHIGGWLNYSFLNDFTQEEKAMIVETTVTADSHPDMPDTDQGADTEHGMYILSVDEVLKYLPNPEDRVCYATDYLQGELTNTVHLTNLQSNEACSWWLRTAYENFSSGAIIASIYPTGDFAISTHNCRHALRPVCWIQLEG